MMHYPKPHIVKPNHPSPTHYNGLSIIIDGEHSGKYVQRIHHIQEGRTKLLLAGVVKRGTGVPDILTDE